MNNVTGGNQTRIQEPLCQHGIYGIHQKVLFSVLNIPISITAFLGNVLIIVALKKVSSLHPPSKLLLSCLASTDLCVGLITLPVYDAYIFTPEYSRNCIFLKLMTNINNGVFGGVSMLTLTAISVDRLLALFLGVRYRPVVTLKRMRVIVATFWILCVLLSMLFFYSFGITIIIVVTFMLLCIIISNVCYARIYLKLHQHRGTRPEVDDNVHQGGVPLNIARYKKTVSTALWVQMTLLTCYLPFGVVVAVRAYTGKRTPTSDLWWAITILSVYLNSALNPILYCWRIREVRQAAKDTIRRLCCQSS